MGKTEIFFIASYRTSKCKSLKSVNSYTIAVYTSSYETKHITPTIQTDQTEIMNKVNTKTLEHDIREFNLIKSLYKSQYVTIKFHNIVC